MLRTLKDLPDNVRRETRPIWKGTTGKDAVIIGQREVLRADFIWEYPDGRKKRIKFDIPEEHTRTKKDLLKFLDARKETLRNETFGRKEYPSFAKWVEEYLKLNPNKNRSGTLLEKKSMFQHHLLPFFGHKTLDKESIKTEDVLAFSNQKEKEGLSPKFVNNLLTTLATCIRIAADLGNSNIVVVTRKTAAGDLAGKLVVKKLTVAEKYQSPITEDEFFNLEEWNQLTTCPKLDPWIKNILIFMGSTGLRTGEMRALNVRDIDLQAGKVVVSRNFTDGDYVDKSTSIEDAQKAEQCPKGVKSRIIELSGSAIDAVRALAHLRGPYLLCHPNGSPLSRNDLSNAVRGACRLAGVKELGPHGLRHTFASHAILAGETLKVLQEALGHVDIKTTMRYSHLDKNAKRRLANSLEAFRKSSQTA